MSVCTGEMGLLCRVRRGWNKQSGDYTEECFEGNREYIYGLLQEARERGAENYDIDHDGAKYTLKVRFSQTNSGEGTETAVDEVRLNANRASRSIYSHPAFRVCLEADIKACRAAIQNADANFSTSIFAPDSDGSLTGHIRTQAQSDAITDLYLLLLQGVDHTIIHAPVLVRTRVASSDFVYSTSGPYDNIGAVVSPASIINDAALSTLMRVILPTGVNDGMNEDFGVGWLKHYPEYTQAAGNKGVLTQEYEYGLWSRVLYGDPI